MKFVNCAFKSKNAVYIKTPVLHYVTKNVASKNAINLKKIGVITVVH